MKCQTEEVCTLCYIFQKERHEFDRWTSIYLSIHPSLYQFIIERMLGEGDKSEETVTKTLWRNSQQLTMELASLVCPPVYHGLKMVITCCLRGARPLILAWGELKRMVTFGCCWEVIAKNLCKFCPTLILINSLWYFHCSSHLVL